MLGRYWKLLMACSIVWTSTVALGIMGTLRADVRLMYWSVMLALVGCMTTAWFIALCAACRAVADDRVEIGHLATIMANVAATEGGVSHLPRPRR